VLRTTRKFWVGFLGALFLSYSFLYSYVIGLAGGHRSWLSHGWIIGTLGRMVFYNIPLIVFLNVLYSYAISNWGWSTSVGVLKSFYFDMWGIPYLSMQFLAWLYGDGVHLILDTNWAKGVLYTPINSKRD